jgi:hypothetical protein
MKVKGKQLENSAISQKKLNLTTSQSLSSIATVEYVNLSGGTKLELSKNNLNMPALSTTTDGDLACIYEIYDVPESFVRVFLNGLELNAGGKTSPYDCYFSGDSGTTARDSGQEQQGDKLYWNTSVAGYNLDIDDILDFNYMVKINQQEILNLNFVTSQASFNTVKIRIK